MEIERIEEFFIRASKKDALAEMQRLFLLPRTRICEFCERQMRLVEYKQNVDGFVWRCHNTNCVDCRSRVSVRRGSAFEGIKIPFKTVIKIILRWCSEQQQFSILRTINISKRTFLKVIRIFLEKIKGEQLINPIKLGGSGCTVNIDETMLNYKCKSHRGRNPLNKSDALCIIELDGHITKSFACLISNKKRETLIPIILDVVLEGSVVHTDEHRSYFGLSELGFIHKTVCHKYQFVNQLTGAQTQAVESFNNCLKYAIKQRKGVKTVDREEFLLEFVWKFNNRSDRINKLFELLRI